MMQSCRPSGVWLNGMLTKDKKHCRSKVSMPFASGGWSPPKYAWYSPGGRHIFAHVCVPTPSGEEGPCKEFKSSAPASRSTYKVGKDANGNYPTKFFDTKRRAKNHGSTQCKSGLYCIKHSGNKHGYKSWCNKDSCFPAAATVVTPSGVKRMSELKVGDCVMSKQPDGTLRACDHVYFFGHAEAATRTMYRQLHLSSGKNISLTPTHFIHTAKSASVSFSKSELKHARLVKVGDWVWDTDGITQVLNTTAQTMQGMYNPYTLSGTIVVDGVVASSHSHWILDDYVPDSALHYLPMLYQAAFFPGRVLFWMAGAPAADFVGLNNPAVLAEAWIRCTNYATVLLTWVGTLIVVGHLVKVRATK